MDHALRTISYIADIGELVVLMARRRPTPGEVESNNVIHQTPKMICHVFESDEVRFFFFFYSFTYTMPQIICLRLISDIGS